MDIKQLKKLINEEVERRNKIEKTKLQEQEDENDDWPPVGAKARMAPNKQDYLKQIGILYPNEEEALFAWQDALDAWFEEQHAKVAKMPPKPSYDDDDEEDEYNLGPDDPTQSNFDLPLEPTVNQRKFNIPPEKTVNFKRRIQQESKIKITIK